jgi:hypothetical protein
VQDALKAPHSCRSRAANLPATMIDCSLDPELQLLRRGLDVESSSRNHDRLQHELQNAPLFTHAAFTQKPKDFQQRGLLGSVLRQQGEGFPRNPDDERIYVNTSAPFSAVICGVQVSQSSSKPRIFWGLKRQFTRVLERAILSLVY